MGNLELNNFCDCDNNDSKFETSFKANQNKDKMLCPFINTVIYQNFNIENGKKNQNNSKTKLKEANFSKNKSKYDLTDCEMNFEYHTTKPNIAKDANKTQKVNKSIFNLNPNVDNEKNSLNDIEINNANNDYNFNENNNQINKILTLENDNENINENINEIEKEKTDLNQNCQEKENEIFSNNSDTSNAKTNIDKPKKALKNGLDMKIFSKNVYYIGYYKDGIADGIGKFYNENSKYFGEFKNGHENGFGIFDNNSNETIYTGYWLNNLQNEYGIEKWNDDSKFLGEYSNGEKNGIGVYIWNDGSRYEGEFNNNNFEGYGIYFYNKNKIYLGEWKDNKKNGYGEFIIGTRLYVGNFLMDEKDGFGISFWKNENKLFIGFWKNNKMNGFGKYFHGNKVKFGIWGEEMGKPKVEWFNSDEEAFNYIENNNLAKYKKYFEFNNEDLTNNLKIYFNDDFISPSIISEI